MTAPRATKVALWQELVRHLTLELEALARAHHETQKGATHEEAKPENDKDTRALEQSYLARGQAARVEEFRHGLQAVIALPLRDFSEDTPIALGALVELENADGTAFRVLLAPAGAGARLTDDQGEVRVITAASPLGRALLGIHLGDTAEYRSPARDSGTHAGSSESGHTGSQMVSITVSALQ